MENVIRNFLETKFIEPLVIKALPYSDVTELYLRSGKNLLAYGLVRQGDLYSYIDWDVPTNTLNEVNPYFDINILECEKIMLDWLKDKFEEQGYNIQNAGIIKQLTYGKTYATIS